MPDQIVILETMPSARDFYELYWNKKPFVVRGAISQDEISGYITPEELAGLSMEEVPRSRFIKTAGEHQDWSCGYGPFAEEDFATAGDKDWSLLIQNVEQFHPETAKLLRHFNFAPRWLLDDIMVSYSEEGGSVGPHLDTYHVFLTQGQGKRRWKISRTELKEEICIQGMDFKVLVDGFEGDEIEVSCGDVLYIPPRFGHEGVTTESALTFSVGILGPKLSELFSGYGQYLSEFEDMDKRYVAQGLGSDSAGFSISTSAVDHLRDSLTEQLNAKGFTQWLVEFFTESSHEDFGEYSERDDLLSADALEASLKEGAGLIKPEYVKFAITESSSGRFYLGFDTQSFAIDESLLSVIQLFMKEDMVSVESYPALLDHPATQEFLLELYNHQALEFT
jgi:50S ribosomal protein L16 3-hydroxylase